MSEEQRAAAAANLAKARAAKKPAAYKSIAANVQALDEDHGLSMVNVKRYIKATTEKMAAYRRGIQSNERGAIAKYESARVYKIFNRLPRILYLKRIRSPIKALKKP